MNLPAIVNEDNDSLKSFAVSVIDNYTSDVKHYVTYLDKNNLRFDFDSFKSYVEMMKREQFPARSINKRIYAVKKRIRQIFEVKVSDLDIIKKYHLDRCLKEIKKVKIQKAYVGEEKIISQDQYYTLIKNKDIPKDIRLMMSFMYQTGLRVSETLKLKYDNLDEYKNCVKVRFIGKGDKQRTAELFNIELFHLIQDHFKGKTYLFEKPDGSQYKRTYVTMRIQRHAEKILGKRISAHTMRHSFATEMIKRTGKIKATSEALGHSTTAVTMDLYVHETLSEKDRKFIDDLKYLK